MNSATWVELEATRLSEIIQPQKRKYPFSPLPKIGKQSINSCKIRREKDIGAIVRREGEYQMPGSNKFQCIIECRLITAYSNLAYTIEDLEGR